MISNLIASILFLATALDEPTSSIYLEDILFEMNSDELDSERTKELERMVKLLKKGCTTERGKGGIKKYILYIEGYTDSTENHADQLSKSRARAVKAKVKSLGLKDFRHKVDWFGDKKPLAYSTTSEGRKRNARVSFKMGCKYRGHQPEYEGFDEELYFK